MKKVNKNPNTTYYKVGIDKETKQYEPTEKDLKRIADIDRDYEAKYGEIKMPEKKTVIEEKETPAADMKVGDRVEHKVYGKGTVVKVATATSYQGKEKTYVSVEFDKNFDVGENTLRFYPTAFTNPAWFVQQ